MKKNKTFWFFILFFVFFSSACFASSLSILEKAMEKIAPEIIGTGRNYRVNFLNTSISDILTGNIKHNLIQADDVELKNTPIMENVKIHLFDINYDLKKINSVKNPSFIVIFNEYSLNKFIENKKLSFPLSVRIKNNDLLIRTTQKIQGCDIPLELQGMAVCDGNKKINLAVKTVKASFIPLPKFICEMIQKNINPVIDLENSPSIDKIESIKALDAKLMVSGKAKINTPIYFKKL